MVSAQAAAYRGAMQEWTRWFRKQQSKVGTVEEFARASGINTRTISDWRSGRIPQRRHQEAIAKVLGSAGPIPGRPAERVYTLEEKILAIDERVTRLEELVNAEPSVLPEGATPAQRGPDAARGGLAAGSEAAERRRQGHPTRGRRGTGRS
jgi:transcriptional regulator with XRE-family HTH domain